jgi:hypothetical protein
MGMTLHVVCLADGSAVRGETHGLAGEPLSPSWQVNNMPNGRARRLSEPDLILPALLVLDEADGSLSTTQLSERLRSLLKPSGEDLEILAGRQDDKFSQKVRNLRSHQTLEAPGYATYESRGRQGYWRITEVGQRVLSHSGDFVRIALKPGFTSSVTTQALSRLNYTNPDRVPQISVFDEDEAVREGARSQAQRTVYERSRRLRDPQLRTLRPKVSSNAKCVASRSEDLW